MPYIHYHLRGDSRLQRVKYPVVYEQWNYSETATLNRWFKNRDTTLDQNMNKNYNNFIINSWYRTMSTCKCIKYKSTNKLLRDIFHGMWPDKSIHVDLRIKQVMLFCIGTIIV